MDWKKKLLAMADRIKPATVAIERAASIAVHLKTPSVVGIAAAASAGINAVSELIMGREEAGRWCVQMLATRTQIIDMFRQAGARIAITTPPGANRQVCVVHVDDWSFILDDAGQLLVNQRPTEVIVTRMREIYDGTMPSVMRTSCSLREDAIAFDVQPLELAPYETDQGGKIWRMTIPLLVTDACRCLLLEGRPGVGKTSMAQELARRYLAGRSPGSDRHRIVAIENKPVPGVGRRGGLEQGPLDYIDAGVLAIANAAVIIVDDIDKVTVSLGAIEALRQHCELLILTANNGTHDEVLDAALMRVGRIDEVFTVTPEHTLQRAPFDQLDPATWNEVREWPIAYLNEIEARLRHRPDDLRIDDLRSRVAKKTRSGNFLA